MCQMSIATMQLAGRRKPPSGVVSFKVLQKVALEVGMHRLGTPINVFEVAPGVLRYNRPKRFWLEAQVGQTSVKFSEIETIKTLWSVLYAIDQLRHFDP